MNDRPRTRICVFAKPPLAGVAKTRLAKDIGAEAAATIAKSCLLDTWNAVTSLAWADPILVGSEDNAELRALAAGKGDFWLQGEGDLGERLQRVCEQATKGERRTLVIGADTPGLPAQRLVQTNALLDGSRAVMGPADDGGFYLLGLTGAPPNLFSDVTWGTSAVFAQMVTRFATCGISLALIDRWFDVDRGSDLVRLKTLLDEGIVSAPATFGALKGINGSVATANPSGGVHK